MANNTQTNGGSGLTMHIEVEGRPDVVIVADVDSIPARHHLSFMRLKRIRRDESA